MPISWTAEEEAKLAAIMATAPRPLSWADIARQMPGRSAKACENVYYRSVLPRTDEAPPSPAAPAEEVKELPLNFDRGGGGVDWRERLKLAQAVSAARARDRLTEDIAKRVIDTDRLHAVLFSSDWQLGSLGVDLATWERHMTAFLDAPDTSMFVVGDMISNVCVHRTLVPVLSQNMTPEEQVSFVSNLLAEFVAKNKLVAVVLSEEHDLRDERLTGSGTLRAMLRQVQVPFFENAGTLVLQVGQVPYVIHAVHRSHFRSILNDLHSGNREAHLRLPANVLVTAHTHRPAIGCYDWFEELARVLEYVDSPIRLGGPTWVVQCGTYETESRYQRQGDFGLLPDPPLQILVFDPHRHHIQIATSFEAAQALIEAGGGHAN
jgi:hypothetical protein